MHFSVVLVPYAMIHQGQWLEKSDSSFSSGRLEDANREWSKKVHEIYEAEDPETVIAMVDCHS